VLDSVAGLGFLLVAYFWLRRTSEVEREHG
jgi:hypothetical protein